MKYLVAILVLGLGLSVKAHAVGPKFDSWNKFAVLGLVEESETEVGHFTMREIRRAFTSLYDRYDVTNGTHPHLKIHKAINDAYTFLSDDQRRAQHVHDIENRQPPQRGGLAAGPQAPSVQTCGDAVVYTFQTAQGAVNIQIKINFQ